MLNNQKIAKNLNKIQKLCHEKGAKTVLKKVIHLSVKKISPPPAKRTLKKKYFILNTNDIGNLREDIEKVFSIGLLRPQDQIRSDVLLVPTEYAKLILEEAEKILKHEFTIYGNLNVSYEPNNFSWANDPITGYVWPQTWLDNSAKIQKPVGTDIKTVWEIARFHFLSSLTYAYILTGEKKYVQFAIDKISSWIDENPFLHKPHWWMPMESSIRVINWCTYLPLLDILDYSDLSFRKNLTRSIVEQLIYIRYNLESSPSQAGNHYLSDLVGLLAAKLIFPSVKWANECTEFAINEFQREVNNQFKRSGIYFQGSLPYHRLGTEIMLIGVALIHRSGLNLSAEIIDRIQQAAKFTKYYTDACLDTPIIGDNDSGIFLKYFPGQESTKHRYLNCLFDVVLENKANPKKFEEFLCCIHFNDTEVPARFNNTKLSKSRGTSQLKVKDFDGLIIARTKSDSLFFSALESSQGHSHNDKLSIYPIIAGNLLFIDRGSFSYTGFWKKRHEDRISSSHNGPLINDWEQNTIWKDDLYYNNGEAKCFTSIEQNSGNLLINGWHIGYDRFRKGLKVFRQIQWNTQDRCISIADWIEGKFSDERFLLKLNFLINPNWSTKIADHGFTFTHQRETVYFEDADQIGFELTQGCYCPCYQIEKNCKALIASTKIRLGDKVCYRLRY